MTPASAGATARTVAPADSPARPADQAGPPHRALRNVLGRYATGVVVVTCRSSSDGQPVAVTINSFTSVSLDPPLILWCLALRSARRAEFAAAGHFAVHVLAASQRDLAIRFAGPVDRLHGLPVTTGPHGLPMLPGTAATLVCRRAGLLVAGDHLVVLGEVESFASTPGPTLVFADGAFHPGPSAECATVS